MLNNPFKSFNPPNFMNILIVKTGALGDVVRSTFLAQALVHKYRENDPKIFWLTDKRAKPIFINNPYVNFIFTLEEKQNLKKTPFDLIINLEEGREDCEFAKSLQPKALIGFYCEGRKICCTKTAEEWFNMSALGKRPQNDILKKLNKKTHRQIMSEIAGVDCQKYEPFLRLTKKQRLFARNFLRRHNLSEKDTIIGLNLGSDGRWPKSLPVKKSAELIDSLYKKFKPKILLFGGPQEIERNQKIIALSHSPVTDTGCGNNLAEFPALISICRLFITTDTLGLHIALALKRKTICLIGPTSESEIDLYGLGKKIVAGSKCTCCYNSGCKSMEKIDSKRIIKEVPALLKRKITLLITAFKEQHLGKTIESVLSQKTKYKFDILVSAPDDKTLEIAKKYQKKSKNLRIFRDPGKGKSYALNQIFGFLETDILILTDGDVYLSENCVEDIVNLFSDLEVGCVTGRPTPVEKSDSKYGYWANFLFDVAHRIRKKAFENRNFIECSGYLFAFRKGFIHEIPLDVAEDTLISYYFWERGYCIGYADKARVFVKNPDNRADWLKQKTRTAKAHETLYKYANVRINPRVKSFKNELKGIRWLLGYPRDILQLFWTFNLALNRFYMWMKVFFETKLQDKHYQDAWERSESTK